MSSRKESDKEGAIRRALGEGILLTTTEAILFELTRKAGTPTFKAISKFYNAASADRTRTVRGYVLNVTDIYELSEDAFDGTPEAGKTVTISGQMHVVA